MERPKFSTVEIVLGILLGSAIDVLAAGADVISFGAGGFILQTGTWLLFTLWFTFKGVKATASPLKRYIIPILVQAVPVLPTTAATFLVSAYVENHPEMLGALGKLDEIGTKIKNAGNKMKNLTNKTK